MRSKEPNRVTKVVSLFENGTKHAYTLKARKQVLLHVPLFLLFYFFSNRLDICVIFLQVTQNSHPRYQGVDKNYCR